MLNAHVITNYMHFHNLLIQNWLFCLYAYFLFQVKIVERVVCVLVVWLFSQNMPQVIVQGTLC